ncbi:MAG: glycine zipper 2TM domain-containing protein [Pseudomonadota bacterium]
MNIENKAGLLSILLTVLSSTTIAASPPVWDPAHGYNDRPVKAYSPYLSLDPGLCHRALLGNALGGAAGAALASRPDHEDDRTLAVLGGTAIGILVGGVIGQWMDSLDQNCTAQALEQAPDNKPISWQGAQPVDYTVTPTESLQKNDRPCRRYKATAILAGQERETWATACRNSDGSWQLAD